MKKVRNLGCTLEALCKRVAAENIEKLPEPASERSYFFGYHNQPNAVPAKLIGKRRKTCEFIVKNSVNRLCSVQ